MSSSSSSSGPHFRLRAPIVVGVLAVVAAARWLAAGVVPIEDEAFVAFRYAANLADGYGLFFNPGAAWEPVLGITSPGYAVILAALGGLGLSGVAGALALNLALDVASAGLLLTLLARRPVLAVTATLAFGLLPELVAISMSGSASPLLCTLLLAALLAARNGLFFHAGALIGLALSVRPEAALLVPVLAFTARGRSERLLALLGPVAVLGAVLLGGLRFVYGSPVPAPVAESIATGRPLGEAVELVVRGALCPTLLHLPLALLGIAGCWRLARERDPFAPLVISAASLILLWLVVGPELSAAAFQLPLLVLVVGASRAALPACEALAARPAPVRTSVAGVAVAATLALGAIDAHHRDGADLRRKVWEPMAAWADEAELARGHETLLATNAGAIGWFGGGVVLDLAGLTWSRRRHVDLIERVMTTAPEYLLLRARRAELEALRAVDSVSRAYYPIRRFSVSGETELEPDLADLSEAEVSDYLLFRRRQ